MSSAFVALTCLHTLVLSITDAHCLSQSLISNTTQGNGKTSTVNSSTSSPISWRQSVSTSNISPASTHMPLAQSEPETMSPIFSPRQSVVHRRRSSVGVSSSPANLIPNNFDDITTASQQGVQGSIGSFDTSIPPKRDIRKFARRCPSLRILQWIGRNGKGEWRIAAGTSSLHTHIDFAPIHLVEDERSKQLTLGSGADVEDFISRKRIANSAHPGKRIPIEEVDVLPSGLVSADDKETKSKPRLDGRLFPRLKKSDALQEVAGVVSPSKSATKESAMEKPKQDQSTKVRTKPSGPLESVVKSSILPNGAKTKTVNSYAAISDPTIVTGSNAERVKVDMKMTVLGESNRRRSIHSGKTTPTLPIEGIVPSVSSSPTKGRSVAKGRETEDIFKGATATNGNTKSVSSTSGAAGRRNKKKAPLPDPVGAALNSTTESINRRRK